MREVDWDGVGSHQKFMDDPSYGPFKKTLGLIMEGVHLFHITPTPFPPTILSEVSLAPFIPHCSFCLPSRVCDGSPMSLYLSWGGCQLLPSLPLKN
jgi:hypothetical protein